MKLTTDQLNQKQQELIADYERTAGSEFFEIYRKHRNNMHIANVLDMLKKMEVSFQFYETKKSTINGVFKNANYR